MERREGIEGQSHKEEREGGSVIRRGPAG